MVGLVIGAVVILLAGPGSGGSGSAGASPSASASSSATPGDTVVTVPAACQDASQNLEEAIRLLRGGVDSVKDFDPQALVTLLDRLETLDEDTRPLVRRCSAVRVETSASPSATQSPAS